MSKAAKQSLIILIVLLLATLGFSVYLMIQKRAVEGANQQLQNDLITTNETMQKKEIAFSNESKKLKEEINKAGDEKVRLEQKIQAVEQQAQQQAEQLAKQLDEITNDRDMWKRRIDTIREERDKLMVKIDEMTKKLDEMAKSPVPAVDEDTGYGEDEDRLGEMDDQDGQSADQFNTSAPDFRKEEHWAGILKAKASLEVEIQKFKDDLAQKSVELVELRQKNEDLQIELDTLKSDNEGMGSDLRHKSDMIDNMSLELARTKNDKKFISDRLEKITEENETMRSQMKQLLAVKNALEKSMVRLGREKEKVAGKLGETEVLIQSKIDEIWEIKDDLDRSIRSAQSTASQNEVELPPIVVSSTGEVQSLNQETSAGYNGKIISLNEANNFVIVDIGENSGISLGENLSVYRDSKYIARLEVIQVRKDISAADIKDQWSKIKVGDIIR